uniref:Uncharacterized protein n=1 Tax=Arundo donax TaxID=35708 RepID=A0A0A8Z943_ARUDO
MVLLSFLSDSLIIGGGYKRLRKLQFDILPSD